MARQSKKIEEFWAKVDKEPVVAKSEYRKMRAKMLWGCLVCGHEWEAEPREMIRAKGSGCRKCAIESHRRPNEVLLEYGEFLKLDVSSPAQPEAVMLINKKKWEMLTREGIGRVGIGTKGYPYTSNWKGKRVAVHRILMGFPETVDHINGIKWDNRLCNLRVATHVQQQMNRGLRKTNKSGVIGVSWSERQSKWMAELRVDRKRVHRSYHEKIEDAADARAKAVREHCGEYAPQSI
jgi:hypothetical protein